MEISSVRLPEQTDKPADTKKKEPERRAAPPQRENPRPGAAVPALALVFTLILGCLSLFGPKKTFSETENRVLAEPPAFRFASLWDGSLQTAWETYFTDHFALRDAWLRLNGTLQTVLGKKELGGVYVGREDHLFLIPGAPDPADLRKKAEAINAFAAANPEIDCYAAIAPNAISVQSDDLPAHVAAPEQEKQIADFYALLKNVKTAGLYAPLAAHAAEYVYFLTDHHWTSLGASFAFEALADTMALPAKQMKYSRFTAAGGFYGTLSSKTGLMRTGDTVELFVPETDVTYYVQAPDTGEKTGSIYRTEFLDTKDKYAVFFGGNAPLTVMRTTAETGRRLIVFKDSYANAMMQFLWPYFEEIVLVDARYFYEDLAPVLRQYAVTDALFLYNADTFWGDTSLADLLLQHF